MHCPHCTKAYTNKIGYSNHVRRCPSNPDRKIETLTPEGRAKIRLSTQQQNQRQWADLGFRQRHRASMQRAVRENPESYTSANRGRCREIIYEDQVFQGSWELEFYQWARLQGLTPLRPEQGFPYQWQGSRLYFPDFWIPELAVHVEVKGYATDRDRAKWSQFPGPLCVIRRAEIDKIKRLQFQGLDSEDILWYNKPMGL